MLSVPLGDNKIHYLEAVALLVTVGPEENRGPLLYSFSFVMEQMKIKVQISLVGQSTSQSLTRVDYDWTWVR